VKNTTHSDYTKRILRVLNYIQANLDEKHNLEKLAGIAYFSPFHFHRIFSAFTGESIAKYIRRLKLERAANSLKYTDKSISIISLEAGYENTESFSRVFKNQFNVTPMEFRIKSKKALKESFTDRLKQVTFQDIEITIVDIIAPKSLICLRHTGKYTDVGPTWNKLMKWVYKNNYQYKSTLGISYDNPQITEEEKIRYDACVETIGEVIPEDDMHRRRIKGGKYAVATIKGAYESLNMAYDYFYVKWLDENNFELKDEPSFEIYKNMTPYISPENYITEIYFPII
jgi:AraC family transcriptional regulator